MSEQSQYIQYLSAIYTLQIIYIRYWHLTWMHVDGGWTKDYGNVGRRHYPGFGDAFTGAWAVQWHRAGAGQVPHFPTQRHTSHITATSHGTMPTGTLRILVTDRKRSEDTLYTRLPRLLLYKRPWKRCDELLELQFCFMAFLHLLHKGKARAVANIW